MSGSGQRVTALLFTVGKLLIGLYLGHASIGSTFGAAGSLLVFLVWVYYSAQILFFGAEFTQVYARYGSRIEPAAGAIALDEDDRAQQGIPHEETVKRAAAEQAAPGVAREWDRSVRQQPQGRTTGVAATAHQKAEPAQAGAGKRQPRGSGGTSGAPDAVKKLIWAGLASGMMALVTIGARRASAGIWRGILHEEPLRTLSRT